MIPNVFLNHTSVFDNGFLGKEHTMRAVLWISIITNVVVTAGLFIYFTVVALNVVHTHKFLTSADVPYYGTDVSFESLADRYHVEYWVYASDFLRFLAPLTLATVIGLALLESVSFAQFNIWVVVLLIILDIIKLIWRLIQFGFCNESQFCRPFDPSKTASAFSNTNFVWEWTVWFNVAFIAVLVVYLVIATQVESGAKLFNCQKVAEGRWTPLPKGMPTPIREMISKEFKTWKEGMLRIVKTNM